VLDGATLALARRRAPNRRTVASVAALAAVLAYTAAALWWSPLLQPYRQWRAAGQTVDSYLAAIATCTADVPNRATVHFDGVPIAVDDGSDETRMLTITLFQDHTLEAALRLLHPGNTYAVRMTSELVLRSADQPFTVACDGPPAARVVVGRAS
jgi:type II secretory pathway component PulM